MKISSSITRIYQDNLDLYMKLETLVEMKIRSAIEKTWHYDGRIKELESFAQKVETCRFNEEEILHDLFACRVVVDNITEINNIKNILSKHFKIIKSLPPTSSFTHKKPEEFPFDDIRLYCTWNDDIRRPNEELIKDLVFEVQIKTYLQHAWSISTHSMIYKGNDIDWKLNRVAFQIKAMLEHAELSIGNAEALSNTTFLPKENKEFLKLKRIHKVILEYWERDYLPKDLKRLAQNINKLLNDIDMDMKEYRKLLNNSIDHNKKITIKKLSPYYTTLQLLNNHEEEKLIQFINKNEKVIFIEELELSENVISAILREVMRESDYII